MKKTRKPSEVKSCTKMLRNLDKLKRGSSGHSLYVYARMKIVLLILIFLFVKNDQRNDNPKSMYAPKCNKGIICKKCHIYFILYDIIFLTYCKKT